MVRGFIQRRKYYVLLAAKRDQEHKLAHFLVNVFREVGEIFSQQQILVSEDEIRTRESPSAPTTLMTSPVVGELDELEDASWSNKIAELAPPDDMLSLPPEPNIVDLVSYVSVGLAHALASIMPSAVIIVFTHLCHTTVLPTYIY